MSVMQGLRLGNFEFNSKFDSGNAQSVTAVSNLGASVVFWGSLMRRRKALWTLRLQFHQMLLSTELTQTTGRGFALPLRVTLLHARLLALRC